MPAKLGQSALNEWARNAGLPWRISCYDSLPSTNYVVKNAIANDEPEGFVAIAFEQRSGYGRLGRAWVSPLGGVYFSVLLRPQVAPQRLASIGPALSFAVCQALANYAASPNDIRIKWPNDVVCPRGKLSGMSCEYEDHAVCIGIGINIFKPATALEVGGKNTPAYLADLMDTMGEGVSLCGDGRALGAMKTAEGDGAVCVLEQADPSVQGGSLSEAQVVIAQRVVMKTLDCLYRIYRQWLEGGFVAIQPSYQAHAAMLGEHVKAVTITDQVIAEGTVEGVDATGCLLLRGDNGDLTPVASGEIHLR